MEDIELPDGLSAIVAQDWELQLVCFCERLVRERIIDAYSDYLSVQSVQCLHRVSESAHFSGANACEGAGKERDNSLLSNEILQGLLFSVLVMELEVRRLLFYLN